MTLAKLVIFFILDELTSHILNPTLCHRPKSEEQPSQRDNTPSPQSGSLQNVLDIFPPEWPYQNLSYSSSWMSSIVIYSQNVHRIRFSHFQTHFEEDTLNTLGTALFCTTSILSLKKILNPLLIIVGREQFIVFYFFQWSSIGTLFLCLLEGRSVVRKWN